MQINKLLIANRGEIALRIHRACHEMGIKTVAVHSTADADAMHVRLADETVCIGPPAATDSYLNIPNIISAAEIVHADAIHPGYGFLSENAQFAEIVESHNIVWVGPKPEHIRTMGDKIEAKRTAAKLGLPLVPGSDGPIVSVKQAKELAADIGYPVLIKAASGGGGRGMKVVEAEEQLESLMSQAASEARSAFGDDTVYMEKYLADPRHIEFQVFGDGNGAAIHLGERDCSLQRRHQKVLEEAPSPVISRVEREAMGERVRKAMAEMGYRGAGTIEFLYENGEFYFIEMNTRLQVEHPVTEMITGVDLVEWQLRVAAGEPLPLRQGQLAITGHAIEARIYAEDPERNFLPSTGRLVHLAPPQPSQHVRVDTGVEEGDSITPFYDPMIAKLIVHDVDRPAALRRLSDALASYRVVGVANNIEFLGRLVATPSFANAELDTALIEREQAALFPAPAEPPADAWLVAGLAEAERDRVAARRAAERSSEPGSPWSLNDGWRVNGRAARRLGFRQGEWFREVDATALAGSAWELELDGARVAASASVRGDASIDATIGSRRVAATVVVQGERRHVFVAGRSFVLDFVDPLGVAGAEHDEEGAGLLAPMPGKVIALLAIPGAAVEKGAPLLVLEAMKMEHTISAPHAGTVKSFRFSAGDQVEEGVALVEFE